MGGSRQAGPVRPVYERDWVMDTLKGSGGSTPQEPFVAMPADREVDEEAAVRVRLLHAEPAAAEADPLALRGRLGSSFVRAIGDTCYFCFIASDQRHTRVQKFPEIRITCLPKNELTELCLFPLAVPTHSAASAPSPAPRDTRRSLRQEHQKRMLGRRRRANAAENLFRSPHSGWRQAQTYRRRALFASAERPRANQSQ